jgi:DNA-directed RNA polymerases I and III subunit RPAC2
MSILIIEHFTSPAHADDHCKVLPISFFRRRQKQHRESIESISQLRINMSVNEVKLKQAVDDFTIKGTGPPSARTFCIGNEDHTLGNALRHILMQNRAVSFAGYSVPHPSEPIVQIRVQTSDGSTAASTLKQSCETLVSQCDVALEKLEDILPEVREDRIRMEALLMEEEDDEDGMDES